MKQIDMSELLNRNQWAGLFPFVVVLCVLPQRGITTEYGSVQPKITERRLMSGKRKEPIIESVCFYYNGSDSQFNVFLKSVIRAYLADDMPAVGIRPIENNT